MDAARADARYRRQMEALSRYSAAERPEINNIFTFATKELSQDAFLGWCINWHNYREDNPRMHQLAEQLLGIILAGRLDVTAIEGLKVALQVQQIDVLVQIKAAGGKYAILIEDKTNTFEHGQQIERYTSKLVKSGYARENVIPVYCKTGFWYDSDYMVNCETTLDTWSLYEVLAPYEGAHSLLDYFIEHLRARMAGWSRIAMQLDGPDYAEAAGEHVGQYLLLNKLLDRRFEEIPVESLPGRVRRYMAETGSNKGAPWLQYTVWNEDYPEAYGPGNEHMLFWRIDCYKEGRYLSLKHYSRMLKDTVVPVVAETRDRAYKEFRGFIRTLMDKMENDPQSGLAGISGLDKTKPGGLGVNERQVLTIYLKDTSLDVLQKIAREITRQLKDYRFPW